MSVRRTRGCARRCPTGSSSSPAGGLVEAERAVKEPAELAAIRAAAALIDEIYAWLLDCGLAGRTERAVALALEQQMRAARRVRPELPVDRRRGRERRAAARDAARRRRSRPARSSRSTSARCSTATARTAPGRGRRATCPTTSRRSTRRCSRRRRPRSPRSGRGRRGATIDAIARDMIGAAGHAEHFGHGLGHGVGIDIHEAPRLARSGRGAARRGQRGHRRAGHLRPGPRRGADRGPRRRHRRRPRRAQRHARRRSPSWGRDPIAVGPQGVRARPPITSAMELRARIPTPLRRAAMLTALVALAAPARPGLRPTPSRQEEEGQGARRHQGRPRWTSRSARR